MVSIGQVQGILLEEVLLRLLKVSGYRTIETAYGDSTLNKGGAGLEVLGRGSKHQIDAIADFIVAQPFSNPQRLLLEAKFHQKSTNKTGIEVVRNAVGVLKDVNEYWVSRDKIPPKARYHYQYAVFSSTGYTAPAQEYAYAQDIYLIPLNRSTFFQPILQTIGALTIDDFEVKTNGNFCRRLREEIRDIFENIERLPSYRILYKNKSKIEELCNQCHQLNGALLGMINRQFPIYLVPNPDAEAIDIRELYNSYDVEIDWDGEGWHIQKSGSGEKLFSFDLPRELFSLYVKNGYLSTDSDLRETEEIQAFLTWGNYNHSRIITFRLDNSWLKNLCNTLDISQDTKF